MCMSSCIGTACVTRTSMACVSVWSDRDVMNVCFQNVKGGTYVDAWHIDLLAVWHQVCERLVGVRTSESVVMVCV